MQRYFSHLVIVLLVAISATTTPVLAARAAVPENTPIPAETLAPLAIWVAQQTHVAIDVLPIAVASDRKLGHALRIDDVQRAGAAAAYLPGRLIVSTEIWEPGSVQSQSYLVHELVHHAQLISGKAYACPAAREREAYELQNRWLKTKGLAPIVTPAFIDRISSCALDNPGDGD
jgi:hypothetical protein